MHRSEAHAVRLIDPKPDKKLSAVSVWPPKTVFAQVPLIDMEFLRRLAVALDRRHASYYP